MAFHRRPQPRLGLWWLVTATWTGPVAAQTPLSFRDALTMARQHTQLLRAADAQVQRARAARSAERGLYYPSLSAAGLYAHLNDRLFVDLDPIRPLLQALNPAVPIPHLEATVLPKPRATRESEKS